MLKNDLKLLPKLLISLVAVFSFSITVTPNVIHADYDRYGQRIDNNNSSSNNNDNDDNNRKPEGGGVVDPGGAIGGTPGVAGGAAGNPSASATGAGVSAGTVNPNAQNTAAIPNQQQTFNNVNGNNNSGQEITKTMTPVRVNDQENNLGQRNQATKSSNNLAPRNQVTKSSNNVSKANMNNNPGTEYHHRHGNHVKRIKGLHKHPGRLGQYHMKPGDIIICYGGGSSGSIGGIPGHVAIANTPSTILEMPGANYGYSKKNNVKDNKKGVFFNRHVIGRHKNRKHNKSSDKTMKVIVFRFKNPKYGKEAASYAYHHMFKNGNLNYAIGAGARIHKKNPSYCSKFVYQAYLYGTKGKVTRTIHLPLYWIYPHNIMHYFKPKYKPREVYSLTY